MTRREAIDSIVSEIEWCFRGEPAKGDLSRDDLNMVRDRVRDACDTIEAACEAQFEAQEQEA